MSDIDTTIMKAVTRVREVGENYSEATHDEAVRVLWETGDHLSLRLFNEGQGRGLNVARRKVVRNYPILGVIDSIWFTMGQFGGKMEDVYGDVAEYQGFKKMPGDLNAVLNRMQHTPWLCALLVEKEMIVEFVYHTSFAITTREEWGSSVDVDAVSSGFKVDVSDDDTRRTKSRTFDWDEVDSFLEYLGAVLRKM